MKNIRLAPIENTPVNAHFADDELDVCHFFEDYLEGEEAQVTNFVASYHGNERLIPPKWLATQASSPRGMIYCHWFGPFRLEEDIEGPHGVMAHPLMADWETWLNAREMLFFLWDDLRELAGII